MGRLNNKFFINSNRIQEELCAYEFHIHTNYTDGVNSIEEIVFESIAKDLEMIVFTEHIEPWFVKSENWFSEYVSEINYFKKKFKSEIQIKIGVEAPAIDLNGNIDITDEMNEKCDYILGAAHRYPGMEGRKISELSSEEAIELEYKTLLGLASNKQIDALAHIGGTCFKYCSRFPNEYISEIISVATSNNIAIEINHVYNQPLETFLSLCAKYNANIVLGSNVHKKEELGAVFNYLKKL